MGALASFMCPFYQKYLLNATIPSLLVMGSDDSYTPMSKFKQVVAKSPRDTVHFVIVPGVDHFWQGHEPEAVVPICAWMLKQLTPYKGEAAAALAVDAGSSSPSMPSSPKSLDSSRASSPLMTKF